MSASTALCGALALLALAVAVTPGPVAAARRVRAHHRAQRPDGTDRGPVGDPIRRRSVLVGAAVALVTAALGGAAGVVPGVVLGVVLGVAAAIAVARRRRDSTTRPDPLVTAGAWDQLAACLRAGLPLERAVRAVAPLLAGAPGAALVRVADLAALGADPVTAWEPALTVPTTGRLARAARRSARTGSAIAEVAETVAADVRAEAADALAARAERAGVLVTGPLGLCFLPAFLALGIVPVVIGLAGPLLEQR